MTHANTRTAIGLHGIRGDLKHSVLDHGRAAPGMVRVQRDQSAQDATS